MNSFLTIDVEEWFMVENLRTEINPDNWQFYESRVEKSINLILDLLDKYNSKATFFTLGWIAEKNHSLIREIVERGNELASHGYSHNILTSMSKK